MAEHNFTLIIHGTADSHLDELYDAGCSDATFGAVDGVAYAEFDREAPTLADAISSAIRAVESVGELRVTHVEPEELVTAAEIANRLGRSRESIRLLAAGERGSGSFPPPVSHLRAHSRLWRWTDVISWAATTGDKRLIAHLSGTLTDDQLTGAHVIAAINGALELRNQREQLTPDERKRVAELVG